MLVPRKRHLVVRSVLLYLGAMLLDRDGPETAKALLITSIVPATTATGK